MKTDFTAVAFFIACTVAFSSMASCTKASNIEREKTEQLKLQLEHNAKTK